MARPTTLFVATDEELVRLFVAVRRSLPEPITTIQKNPVTHQVIGAASWDPGEGDPAAVIGRRSAAPASRVSIYAEGPGAPIEPVLPPSSPAAILLEETAPVRLRALPHAAVTGVTGLELETLAVVLLGQKMPPARIVETLDDDGFVESLPGEALAPLASLDDGALPAVAERWNLALRVTRRSADPAALVALRALAHEARARAGNVFTHVPL